MFIVNSEQRIECNDANIAYFYIATIEFREDNLLENPNVTNTYSKLVKIQVLINTEQISTDHCQTKENQGKRRQTRKIYQDLD